jgi:signal transduction histidine kinase
MLQKAIVQSALEQDHLLKSTLCGSGYEGSWYRHQQPKIQDDRSSSLSPSIEKIVLMADVINRNAKRLEKMTSNLLDLLRIENDKPLDLSKEKFDLRKKIENVVNDICNTTPAKDIRIRFESNLNMLLS